MLLRQFPDQKKFSSLFDAHNVVPLCREILADMDTPVTVLKKIYPNAGPAFLFESVEGGERWGRYSFLSVSARTHVRIFKTHVEIIRNGSREKFCTTTTRFRSAGVYETLSAGRSAGPAQVLGRPGGVYHL
ncbi:MAG: hypothetical protein R2875_01755 [Desulfobacterales bacterium]